MLQRAMTLVVDEVLNPNLWMIAATWTLKLSMTRMRTGAGTNLMSFFNFCSVRVVFVDFNFEVHHNCSREETDPGSREAMDCLSIEK